MSLHARGRARLAWLDRFIVPRETPLAPSRWHQHIVQRRVSRLDHLRPHRLNWEALKHPEPAAGEEDETLTPRRLAGIRWSWLDGFFTTVSDNLYLGFIVLYALAYGASTSQLGLLAAGTTTGLWSAVAGNRPFLGPIVSGFVWNLALQVAAPFFNVYLVRHLSAGAGTVGLLAGVNTLFGLIGSALFGRVMDRLGTLKTQALTGLLIPIIPTAWIWVTAPWQVGAGRLFGILLYIWLAVWPILGARGSRPAPSPARAV